MERIPETSLGPCENIFDTIFLPLPRCLPSKWEKRPTDSGLLSRMSPIPKLNLTGCLDGLFSQWNPFYKYVRVCVCECV